MVGVIPDESASERRTSVPGKVMLLATGTAVPHFCGAAETEAKRVIDIRQRPAPYVTKSDPVIASTADVIAAERRRCQTS
jgi:hypothetical protein